MNVSAINANNVAALSGELYNERMMPHKISDEVTQKTRTVVRLRLRDKHAPNLERQARAVNVVWNYCNETQKRSSTDRRGFLSGYDLMRLTNGSSTELGLHAHTIQRVCRTYADSRFRQKKAWLRWRGRKSLGWVPFNTGHVSFDGSTFKFNGVRYEAMHARDLLSPGMKFGAGSFCSDSKGRWYINLPIEVECSPNDGGGSVGIDLGLKSLATLSSGEKIKAPKFYRKSERAIADAQRARKSKRAKALHQKIKNRRRDFLHKHALAIAKKNSLIVVGGIEPINLAKTHMSKSMHDVGWSDFKNMLAYKAIRHGGRMIEVNEAFTSQTCSECGSLPPSRPRGIAGLGIREWVCDECGAVHDRDVNAARNILRIGLNTLVGGAHD